MRPAITAALERDPRAGQERPWFFRLARRRRDEDVHAFVERELVARVGDAGRRLHTGRSRNEQVAVDLRLYLKRRVPTLQRAIAALASALARSGGCRRRRADAVLHPHAPRAADPRVALLARACRGAAARSPATSSWLLDEVDELPLGSGAIAGTSYAIDVNALASRLGFSRVVANSVDATGDRDFVATFLHAAAMTMVHLSRMCRRSDPLYLGGIRVLRSCRLRGDRQQSDAAEEESRSAGTRARESRPGHRHARRVADDDEGTADRLQQGSAGGQGSAVRRGRHAARVAGCDRSRRQLA